MKNLWNTLKTGLQTYCEQNNFKKAVLGLSGGLDSAVCAVLAADVLGGCNVSALMMKTRYTSNLSLQIAREIAALNNLDYHELDIDSLFENQLDFLKTAFNTKPESIVAENLQARLRGQILMAWSNQFSGLVLACSNKSEKLTGYCTLYGDTCGGLAPISDVYKSTLFELAKWRNTQSRVLPDSVILRAPSAELKAGQKDEDNLPPYALLDSILKALYDEKQSISELIKQGFDEKTLLRVQELICCSAFKRKQAPQAIKL
jgi:NAD+ synthase (glutamine-hydrolysing)